MDKYGESVFEMVAKILLFHHNNDSLKFANGNVMDKMNKERPINVSNDFRNDIMDVIEVDGMLDHFIIDVFHYSRSLIIFMFSNFPQPVTSCVLVALNFLG